ncbi:XRN 5'-3' exonuclease N-terminus-domain-containing protein [Sporodiniella umbellata]|nr:XRN 5'-3' exonuclease N-terminus-domain-containing protein [Sporodiniella umbellata]
MRLTNLLKLISERYPLTVAHVSENDVQEFDNLYLDITKISQDCCTSRPNEQEDLVWKKASDAIDRIFSLVKPKKVFYLVMDGVTPRVVENAQRSTAYIASSQAWSQPSGLDANCMVAGTRLSTRLAEQLRYFVTKKVSEDSDWQNVEVIFSGPDVPGEGNQKIMEYVRLQRSLTTYNPDTRHCIYGLEDENLLAGLSIYDAHTSLLVDKTVQQRFIAGPTHKKYVTVHIGLLREYLYEEFDHLALAVPFTFMNVRIVDDFVCLCLLLKNKYLPQLPHLEDYQQSLECIISIYKDLLPTWDGYLHESGLISIERLETIFKEITCLIEKDAFNTEYARATYQESSFKDSEYLRHNIPEEMTENQGEIYTKIRDYMLGNIPGSCVHFNFHFTIQDRSFIGFLTKNLKVSTALSYNHGDQITEVEIIFAKEFSADRMDSQVVETLNSQSEEMREMRLTFLNEYKDIPVVSEHEKEQDKKAQAEAAFISWNECYYKEKLDIDSQEEQKLNDTVDSYMTGIQWVLHYFYKGVASWSWFYPYRYAPKPSDLKKIRPLQDYPYDFDEPLKPHEHLMMVLPGTGRRWLPTAYQSLMAGHDSTVMHFYPQCLPSDVSHDRSTINIPFISRELLLEAMEQKEFLLTNEELESNNVGNITRFLYDPILAEENLTYSSPLPEVFPDVNPCLTSTSIYSLPSIPSSEIQAGCISGAKCGSSSLGGFPSFEFLPYELTIEERVAPGTDNVTNAMIVKIKNKAVDIALETLAQFFLCRKVYIGYPTMKKAIVVAVSSIDGEFRVGEDQQGEKGVYFSSYDYYNKKEWNKQKSQLEKSCSDQGIMVAEPDAFIMYVVPLVKVEELENSAIQEYYSDLLNAVPVLSETIVIDDCSYVIPRNTKPKETVPTAAWADFAANESHKQLPSSLSSSPPKRESSWASHQSTPSSFGSPQKTENQWSNQQPTFSSSVPSLKKENQWASQSLSSSPPKRESQWASHSPSGSSLKGESQWASHSPSGSSLKGESQWASRPPNGSSLKGESRPPNGTLSKEDSQWASRPPGSSPPEREHQWANYQAAFPAIGSPPKRECQWTSHQPALSSGGSPQIKESQWASRPTIASQNSSPSQRRSSGNLVVGSPNKNSTAQSAWGEFARSHEKRSKY